MQIILSSVHSRLVLKCGLAHLNANANARDESNASANANAQQLNQMQMHLDQMQIHLDQIQIHLDQMQMEFYNYVFAFTSDILLTYLVTTINKKH